jgi:SAM-dependent methyltransferase
MISIITTIHAGSLKYLPDAYASLLAQSVTEWEWFIGEKPGCLVPADIKADPRVRTLVDEGPVLIGSLKRFACMHSTGEFMLELDADDELLPRALERAQMAFDCGADFVYSDCAYWRDMPDGTIQARWDAYPFGQAYGWSAGYEVEHRGTKLAAMEAPPVTPMNIRLVDWSPDHFRAWRRSAYMAVGCHDATMMVGDDHDLIVRMYLNGARFAHIPECLYAYRVHGDGTNTTSLINSQIRDATWGTYNRFFCALAEKQARDRGLLLVDLCGAIGCPPGYTPIDHDPIVKRDGGICCNLDGRWDLGDQSVGLLRAYDAIEHLRSPLHTMSEAYRVLAPGGVMMISVPSSNGVGAFCDPTHVSFWNKLSFRYYANPGFARYVKFNGSFQVAKLIEWFPSEWHRAVNMPYVEAHLIRLGTGYHPMGSVV